MDLKPGDGRNYSDGRPWFDNPGQLDRDGVEALARRGLEPKRSDPAHVVGPVLVRWATPYRPAVPSWVDTVVNMFFIWPPMVLTVTMIPTEMPAAMIP